MSFSCFLIDNYVLCRCQKKNKVIPSDSSMLLLCIYIYITCLKKITEILWKVALNTINQIKSSYELTYLSKRVRRINLYK